MILKKLIRIDFKLLQLMIVERDIVGEPGILQMAVTKKHHMAARLLSIILIMLLR